jgi:hypothetical protein
MQIDLIDDPSETINFPVKSRIMKRIRELAFREGTTVARQLHVALSRYIGVDPGIVQPRIPERLLARARVLEARFPSPFEFDSLGASRVLGCSSVAAAATLEKLTLHRVYSSRLDPDSRRKRILYRRLVTLLPPETPPESRDIPKIPGTP